LVESYGAVTLIRISTKADQPFIPYKLNGWYGIDGSYRWSH